MPTEIPAFSAPKIFESSAAGWRSSAHGCASLYMPLLRGRSTGCQVAGALLVRSHIRLQVSTRLMRCAKFWPASASRFLQFCGLLHVCANVQYAGQANMHRAANAGRDEGFGAVISRSHCQADPAFTARCMPKHACTWKNSS